MRDYLTIAPSPCEEECAQVGESNYHEKARKECKALIHQLRRQLGEEPSGAYLTIKSFQHDFGSYLEVCCVYEDSIPEAVEYAFKCEAECPEKWDDKALIELEMFKRL